jgi:hypothetical protein
MARFLLIELSIIELIKLLKQLSGLESKTWGELHLIIRFSSNTTIRSKSTIIIFQIFDELSVT